MKFLKYILPVIILFAASCSTFHKEKYEYGKAVLEFALAENNSGENPQIVMQVTDYKIAKINGNNFQSGLQIVLNDYDAAAFADVTSNNEGKYMSIRTDDLMLITAVIMTKIPDGKIMITIPERAEADRIYNILRGKTK
ncbi:MAG: hypothetical protein JW982_11545 [Spirochaetes bacterium]|nr:hypothetical protein [Spirochaetota bacterium]